MWEVPRLYGDDQSNGLVYWLVVDAGSIPHGFQFSHVWGCAGEGSGLDVSDGLEIWDQAGGLPVGRVGEMHAMQAVLERAELADS